MLFIDVAPTAYFHLPCNYVSPTLLPACVGHGALLRTLVTEAPGRPLRESGRSCHCFIRADPSPGVSDFSDGAGGARGGQSEQLLWSGLTKKKTNFPAFQDDENILYLDALWVTYKFMQLSKF